MRYLIKTLPSRLRYLIKSVLSWPRYLINSTLYSGFLLIQEFFKCIIMTNFFLWHNMAPPWFPKSPDCTFTDSSREVCIFDFLKNKHQTHSCPGQIILTEQTDIPKWNLSLHKTTRKTAFAKEAMFLIIDIWIWVIIPESKITVRLKLKPSSNRKILLDGGLRERLKCK